MALQGKIPPRVLLDAGPIIGAFNEKDRYHLSSSRGLAQLVSARSRILVPIPVAFEVFKWFSYQVGPTAARRVLRSMRLSFEIIVLDIAMLGGLEAVVNAMPLWKGSLEDAALAVLGRELRAAVWTYNYRDLAAFKDLEFWSPN